jgi:thiamine-phosphate pyrophosphorylase
VVAAALAAGADTIQVRVPDATTDRDAYELATRVAQLCKTHGVPCLVNDRLHIALAVGADGGHVGADDLPVSVARRILGPHAILGATARDPATARRAVADGASYLGVGPAYATSTKDGLPDPIGPQGVAAVAQAVPVPVIAIGGVTVRTVAQLRGVGAHGVAVVGAISGAADPAAATAELHAAVTTATSPAPPGPAVAGPDQSGKLWPQGGPTATTSRKL